LPKQAALRGAKVILVSGKVNLEVPLAGSALTYAPRKK